MSSITNTTRDLDNKRKRLTQACELCRRKKVLRFFFFQKEGESNTIYV